MDSRSIVGECIGDVALIEIRRPIAEVNGVFGDCFGSTLASLSVSTLQQSGYSAQRNLRSCSKLTSVIGGPIKERVRRCAGDLCDCRGSKCSVAGSGGPSVEEHPAEYGPDGELLTPPLAG
jgi:hypothetical protein